MQGPPRMMNPNGPPGNFRPMHPGMGNMQGPPGPQGMPPRMPVSNFCFLIFIKEMISKNVFK